MNSYLLRFAVGALALSIFPALTYAEKDYTTSIPLSGCHAKEDFASFSNAMKNRDRQTFRELTRSGKCLTVQPGTKVKVIQHDEPLYSQIETLGGDTKKLWTIYLGNQ